MSYFELYDRSELRPVLSVILDILEVNPMHESDLFDAVNQNLENDYCVKLELQEFDNCMDFLKMHNCVLFYSRNHFYKFNNRPDFDEIIPSFEKDYIC